METGSDLGGVSERVWVDALGGPSPGRPRAGPRHRRPLALSAASVFADPPVWAAAIDLYRSPFLNGAKVRCRWAG
jgi:hypothetical protein